MDATKTNPSPAPQVEKNRVSFKEIYRLTFVLFSLYLLGDAFYRWDGFSYYASFSEFLPSVALAFILWSIVSVFAAILVWTLSKVFQWGCSLLGIHIHVDQILLYAIIFVLTGSLVWKVKKLIWPLLQTTLQVKLIVLSSVFILSVIVTWLLRERAKRWAEIIFEKITPLVWLFGILVLLAVPLVAYHTWINAPDKTVSHDSVRHLPNSATRPNIILVTFDALAVSNMSAYGYHRETTPFINKWASNAIQFGQVEASCNFTTPSAASLMTGKRVWTHQTYHIEGSKPVKSKTESLPSLLKDNGYYNIAIVVNPFASIRVLGMAGSFHMAPLTSEFGGSASLFGWKFGIVDVLLYRAFGDRIRLHNWILKNDFIFSKFINLVSRNISETPVPPEKAFKRFLSMMDSDLPRPFFAWVHLFPPHDPYLPPGPFRGGFNSSDELRTYKKQEELIDESYKYLFQHMKLPGEMAASVDLMRDHYDEYLKYVDNSFGEFIQELDKRDIKNTITILTSDHGESFQHGYLTHGGPFLYEQVTRIPLIIQAPGQAQGQKVGMRVEQIDVPATILDLAKIQAPSWMEGRSLVPLMQGKHLEPRPAFSMNFEINRSRGHEISRGSIAVWEDDYKLVHYLEKGESLLFNLKQDPEEMINLHEVEPETSRRLLKEITDNLDKANKLIRETTSD
ncbi:MAG: sulfatase-like hydrolase/transferase [Nitrospirae bacterium]|nr:sulfatase-like hydrolase/transferase [Nitrospirota bacterium]